MGHIKPVRARSSYSFKTVLVLFCHPCSGLPGVLLLSGCPTKLCLHLCSFPIRATCPTHPVTLYSVSSTGHEAAFYAVFSSLLLLPVCFSTSSLEHPLPMFFPSYAKYRTKNRPAKAAFSPRRLRVLDHPPGQTVALGRFRVTD
jgi:hypothetical protein